LIDDAPSGDHHYVNERQQRAPIRVLVVDDEESVRIMVRTALASHPDIEVIGDSASGEGALTKVDEVEPDVVVLDVHMPGLDGVQTCERLRATHPNVHVVALSGYVAPEDVSQMVIAGAEAYAVKGNDPEILCQVVLNAMNRRGFVDAAAVPGLFDSVVKLAREERVRREDAERLALELEASYHDTVRALVTALRSRDTETEDHGERVAARVISVGRRLGLDGQQLSDLEYGAVFHDIGKIAIPDSILHNTDDLTESEWAIVRQHTVVGERIIGPVGFLANVARIVRHTHEHWDGTGYPDGLAGEAIPVESRIIFCCDAFDAMTSERSYQRAMTTRRAVDRLHELAGSRFDPGVVDALCAVIEEEQGARQS
jgi:response regulator RpfG family c-di-GMP phosphodiesterase